MDIRQYVWITKVPGGLKTDSHLVSGVVFRKNISHKRMASVYNQPKILMMSCAIEYQVYMECFCLYMNKVNKVVVEVPGSLSK